MAGLLLISTTCSCVDNDRDLSTEDNTPKIPKEQFFDFDMYQKVAVDIDYCFKNQTELNDSYRILFEIYDQDPFIYHDEELTADGSSSWEKKDIKPIYAGATDKNGKFSGEMTISASLSKVWLYSDYLGTVPVELTIEGNRVSFNQDAYIKGLKAQASSKTRGITTTNNHNVLEGWYLLPGADWDDNGRPNNLEEGLNIPPADILYNIKYVFRKENVYDEDGKKKLKNICDNYPQFIKGDMTSDIPIVKPTEVSLVFVNSSAAWYNTVGYYTYPTGTTPTIENIKKTIAFPNVSPIYKTLGKGALVCGEEVKLKYWNEDEKKYEDEFPKGVTIGWCLQGMGFKSKLTGNTEKIADIVKGMGTRYSTKSFNKDVDKQRTVSLRDEKSGKIVAIGFEDNIDMDYCDALFYIHTSEEGAVSPNLPPLPEDDKAKPNKEDKYKITYSGTLSFEDLWPKEGDYDMNDIIIQYNSTISKMVLDNKIYEIEDKFTVQHRGGYLITGFGYQFQNLLSTDINNIEIIYPEGAKASNYMQGQQMEPGQTYPTVLLFDDINNFDDYKEEAKRQFTVKTQVNGLDEKQIVPPYNPFIFIDSDKGRGKEVHLVNYPPTDKADTSLLGTGIDLSRPDENLYYVSVDMMPFAINMPVSEEVERELISKLKDPKNEKTRIDVLYPRFASWAKSNGKKDKDWYIQK